MPLNPHPEDRISAASKLTKRKTRGKILISWLVGRPMTAPIAAAWRLIDPEISGEFAHRRERFKLTA
jgi:hypothetical protein